MRKRDGVAGGDSLYYCGVQARISQFVLSEASRNRTKVQSSSSRYQLKKSEESESEESEYSQIDTNNIYGRNYDVKWR